MSTTKANNRTARIIKEVPDTEGAELAVGVIDGARPIASLCELAGVTLGHLARKRGFAPQSLKDGANVGIGTLAAHAAALGYCVEVTIKKVEGA